MIRLAIAAASAVIGIAFMGSGLITPLYALYQREFGFSEVTLTLIYAAYVVGNLAALLFFGKLSDGIGRRPVALAGIAASCLSALLFLFAASTVWLFLARVLSGVSVGLAAGTASAWLADVDDKSRATTAASVANAFGFALGPLVAGLLAQYTAAPLKTPFYAYLPALLIVGALVALARETAGAAKRGGARPWTLQRVGVPREIRTRFIAPAIAAFGTYALVGYYAALIPTILAKRLHQTGPLAGGAIVFELAFLAGLITLATRAVPSYRSMLLALLALFPSVALLLLAQSLASMALLVIAAAFASIAWGFGVRGSLQVVNEIAPEQRRAEVTSSYFIAGFAGNSIPVIGIGLIAAASSEMLASVVFGCTIAAFAAVAIAADLRSRARRSA